MQPENPSTPSLKPVMDVKAPAKAPAASAQSLPVQQAPAEQDDAPPITDNNPLPVAAEATTSAPTKVNTPKNEHRAPVGIIVVTLCFMLGLAAIAIAIYFKSR
jgi:hypothetical protein